MNKWDLVKPRRRERQEAGQLVEETRARLFFLHYAPVSVASAATGENIDLIFASIETIQRAARQRIGTGVLNRLLRQAFETNPPPSVKGRRLKLFYATQPKSAGPARESFRSRQSAIESPEFVLFVNNPRLINETYRRYLEAQIREAEPYLGLPIA